MTTPKDKAWAALAADIPTFSQAQADAIVARHRPIIEAAISAEPLDVLNAAAYMLGLVDSFYGTDHEPDPENANDEAAYNAEAQFRKHREVIENAIAALGEPKP